MKDPQSLSARIEEVLERRGPMTGSDLQALLQIGPLLLWRACVSSENLIVRPLGRRFLRLDRSVESYARLSPSIRREFLTYTVIGLKGTEESVAAALQSVATRARTISAAKRRLARWAMEDCLAQATQPDLLRQHAVFILAGDIVYELAHDVPRPEQSTGQMVRGSDLDIVVVADEYISPQDAQALDDVILKKKHYLLVHPDYREEIDYVIKPFQRVEQQCRIETFEHMVACKILNEGEFLLGSYALFERLKKQLKSRGIPEALQRMEEKARAERQHAEAHLLAAAEGEEMREYLHLFYTREEKEEIY